MMDRKTLFCFPFVLFLEKHHFDPCNVLVCFVTHTITLIWRGVGYEIRTSFVFHIHTFIHHNFSPIQLFLVLKIFNCGTASWWQLDKSSSTSGGGLELFWPPKLCHCLLSASICPGGLQSSCWVLGGLLRPQWHPALNHRQLDSWLPFTSCSLYQPGSLFLCLP